MWTHTFLLELAKAISRGGMRWTATLLDRGFQKVCHKAKTPITPEDGELVRKKVVPVRLKDYIEVRSVISPIHYLYVKKGLYNVMIVYNGTVCGLNDSIWALHF